MFLTLKTHTYTLFVSVFSNSFLFLFVYACLTFLGVLGASDDKSNIKSRLRGRRKSKTKKRNKIESELFATSSEEEEWQKVELI